jgi:hypothetical protein
MEIGRWFIQLSCSHGTRNNQSDLPVNISKGRHTRDHVVIELQQVRTITRGPMYTSQIIVLHFLLSGFMLLNAGSPTVVLCLLSPLSLLPICPPRRINRPTILALIFRK